MKHILIATIAAVLLVGCGPSVDIHQAAREGSIEAVQQHIATGTDVSTKDGSGRTPLHNGALKGRKEIAELLIAGGADVNAKDGGFGDATTPLHIAALSGHMGIAELLIANGTDVNAQLDDGPGKGQTPVDLAIVANRVETAALLRKHEGKTGAELKAEVK
jgi:ankyrin repeat protein